MAAPAHIALFLDGPNQFALAAGPSAEHPPDFDTPLVGVVSLAYAASSSTVGLLLFDGVAAAHHPAAAPDGDLVFVVPVAGPLGGWKRARNRPRRPRPPPGHAPAPSGW